MGSNKYGQLGVGVSELILTKNSPILVEKVPVGRKIVQVSCGGNCTMVLLEADEIDNNSCYGWGQGEFGTLGTSMDHN